MKQVYFIILFFIIAFSSKAQTRHIIKFTDKKNSPYSVSQPSVYLSQKAIQRRFKQNITIDSTDLPVNPFYIDSLTRLAGVTIINSSKWLNQVLIEVSDPAALDIINACSFVKTVNVVAFGISNNTQREPNLRQLPARQQTNSVLETQGASADSINYGNNDAQVRIHEGQYLHKLGFRGQGMTIALLDAGYLNYKTNPAFDSVRMNGRVIAEYDFVKNETSVNEDNVHGANCFSILGANNPGVMVGTSPNANFILFRTEDASSEKPVEEQYWIAAAERADSMGVDLISSSLGYVNFDNSAYNHSYAQRDGNTAMITIAADIAAKKGIIVVNAIGNSGNINNDTKYVMCPADGDSVLAVGAVNTSGVIGSFSSWGPGGSGKRKPNIVSVGWQTVYTNSLGNTATGNGTSYAAPNVAGLVACLWQAFPEFTNMEILDAVQRSADRYNNPDDRYGHGIPNFRIAYQVLLNKRNERNPPKPSDWLRIYPSGSREKFSVYLKAPVTATARLRLIDIWGRILQMKSVDVIKNNTYTIPIETKFRVAGVYFVQYTDGKNSVAVKMFGH
jgi:subtilisin family serine protease